MTIFVSAAAQLHEPATGFTDPQTEIGRLLEDDRGRMITVYVGRMFAA